MWLVLPGESSEEEQRLEESMRDRHAGEVLETEACRWEVHEQVGLNLRAQEKA